MLDNFAHICETGTDAPVPPEGLRYPVQLEDLTNDVQWPSSVMKVRGIKATIHTQHSVCPLSSKIFCPPFDCAVCSLLCAPPLFPSHDSLPLTYYSLTSAVIDITIANPPRPPQAYCYSNKDIMPEELKLQKPENKDELMVVRGPGSVVESAVEGMRACHKGRLPSKVVLTGEWGTSVTGADVAHRVGLCPVQCSVEVPS